MSNPTIRIRLAQQPPLYLLVAVVVASLCPLLMQLWSTPTVASLERLPALALAPDSLQRVRLPPVAEEPAQAPAAVTVEDAPREPPEELDAVVILDEPAAPARRVGTAKPKPRTATPAQQAKAACARKDKATARTAYRRLPVGDARRKDVRRTCRDHGVWVL